MKALAGRDTSGCRRICAQNVSHKKKGPGAQRVMKALGRKGYSGLPTVLCAECVACTGQNSRTMEGQPACMRAHMGQSGGANGRARVPHPAGAGGAERKCQRPSPGTTMRARAPTLCCWPKSTESEPAYVRTHRGRAGLPTAEPGYPTLPSQGGQSGSAKGRARVPTMQARALTLCYWL